MSRQASSSSQRNLTLTEELEKLEQSITLTLQEIDNNFNRAHRIVTSSILPVVEKYAEQSKNVWEGSKFWKQFFEASANVSLNGYEESAGDDEEGVTEDETLTTEETTGNDEEEGATPSSYSSAPQQEYPEPFTPASTRFGDAATPTNFSSPSRTTPRAAPQPSVAVYASPYEALRREVQGSTTPSTPSASTLPSTPRAQTFDDEEESDANAALSTGRRLPPIGVSDPPPSTARKNRQGHTADPVMHRVLDKTYRVQATPHRNQPRIQVPRATSAQQRQPKTPASAAKGGSAYTRQLDLDSSPLEEAPQLHTDMFGSPGKRIPGVSVLESANRPSSARRTIKDGNGATDGLGEDFSKRAETGMPAFDDSDSDDDYDLLPKGMSPPKTMQFHIPQSKLLKTPAKEAGKKIMDDLLMSAGDDLGDDVEPDSPSIVKRGFDEEDSF